MSPCSHFLAATALLGGGLCQAADQVADIKDYLVDIGAGHVAANEIIGLAGSAVSNLQTPKDLVAALNSIGDSSSKEGFGIAFAPGRSGFRPMGVPVTDYANPSNVMARLWGSTTFSYAQNKKTIATTDYAQSAVAVHVSYYLRAEEDPIVVGYRAVRSGTGSACDDAASTQDVSMERLNEAATSRFEARRIELRVDVLPKLELDRIRDEVRLALQRESLAETLPSALSTAKAAATQQSTVTAAGADLQKSITALTACARKASADAAAKWNASHINLVLGQGWIKSSGADAKRVSLGHHVAVALALSTKEMPNSLFNLTLRRVSRELDLDTLGATPAYKRTNVAAARYTYGYGEGKDTYALAEFSNVKSGSPTLTNAAFKHALGLDRKLAQGVWLEMRVGRSRSSDGTKMENKALFNVKLSPASTLGSNASN